MTDRIPMPALFPDMTTDAGADRWDGLPEKPDKNGKHWLKSYSEQGPMLREWIACDQFWIINTFGVRPLEIARTERYIGPVAPPRTMALLREPSEAMVKAVATATCESLTKGRNYYDIARAAIAAVLRGLEG